MRDDDPMAVALSTQLERLHKERDRLDELLMLDANWRALRQLEARIATGEPVEVVDGASLRDGLLKALAGNRIHAARTKLQETIELLSADHGSLASASPPASLASRIVLLSEPSGGRFRARLRMKPAEVPVTASTTNSFAGARTPAACSSADALELIDGLGRRAVEQLLEGGVTRYCEIANWTSVDVGAWRARLDGIALGSPGWWIEQAAVLAQGRSTHFAERVRRGEYAMLVPAPDDEPPRPWSPDLVPSTVEATVLEVAAAVDTPRPPPLTEASGMTAEELARRLAGPGATPPPLPVQCATLPVTPVPSLPVSIEASSSAALAETAPSVTDAPRRQGYFRPRATPSVQTADSEVEVIAGAEPPRPKPIGPPGTERPRSLLQRLKELQQPDRFVAEAYAAYRGSVEEASVTILRSGAPGREATPAAPAGTIAPKPARPASRFLKALTGKG